MDAGCGSPGTAITPPARTLAPVWAVTPVSRLHLDLGVVFYLWATPLCLGGICGTTTTSRGAAPALPTRTKDKPPLFSRPRLSSSMLLVLTGGTGALHLAVRRVFLVGSVLAWH